MLSPEKEIRLTKRLLYDNSSPRPPKEIISDISNADIESFSPSPIPNEDSDSHMEEIDLYLNLDDPMPPGIEEDDDDSERDTLILEELLDNYSLLLPTNESYHFDIPLPYRPPAKPPDGNTKTLNIKMRGDVSDQKVPIPNLTITRILNPEKSPDLLSHLGCKAFQPSAECPMMINGKNTPVLDVPLFNFYPLDQPSMGELGQAHDNDYSHDLPSVNPLIDHHCCYECGNSLKDFFCPHCTCEFCGNDAHKQEEKRIEEEQAAKARNSKIPACCDDDDDYNSAITPNEPIDSLSMGDEHLDTISTMKSKEFIKSYVQNLVPNPSESEGENGFDVLACFTTFSNILFDAEYEFDSSDDQSLSDEDFPKEIFSNPLFEEEIISTKIDPHHFDAESYLIEYMLNRDSSIISSSSKIDSLLDEFIGELTLLKSIPSGIDKTDCYPEEDIHLIERLLYDNSSPHPPKEFVSKNSDVEIESFSPSPIPVEDSDSRMEEIDLSFNPDDPMSLGIEDDDYDSERDILILNELPSNYSLSLPENESFYFDIPLLSRPPAKPPDGNTRILNIKMMGDNSKQKIPIPGLTITRVSNQEKSPDLLSHRSPEIFQLSAKCPMMIHGKNILIMDVSLFHFYPL
uniref:Reverse transcriptase domain-containing protein n=1 Tax=Tanacetum cinerariifolium TaxID=118510 RepID=A0A699IYV1_TANCI|nr:hypothetical protein [Tanacetum cinerariifolium]